MQKALETFTANERLVGIMREGHEVLAPVSHTVTRAGIEITLDSDGAFVSAAAVDKNAPKIPIPVTEESSGRSSAPCPHPLCDYIDYVSKSNPEKHRLYAAQLEDWASSEFSHPMLMPILNYVKGGSIREDLSRLNLISDKDGGKQLIRWRVIGIGDESGPCWTNQSLFDSFIKWYRSKRQGLPKGICMISGEYTQIAKQHAKGISAANGNAKLISANDSVNFTYRGRFGDSSQALTVGYEASQKAHNVLKWLAAEQGVSITEGSRVFLCWNPPGKKLCHPGGPFRRSDENVYEVKQYRRDLGRILNGYKAELSDDKSGVVVAAFDAATSGRLSLTYYNELTASDFLDRMYNWDKFCCWQNGKFGIQSPLLRQIVNCAYGTQRGEKLETDSKLMAQQLQRLLACRVDNAKIPWDIVKCLADRASNSAAYSDKIHSSIMFTACALINKYQKDYKGEDVMAWSLDKHDRSFQFGRLLAVLERAEEDYYYKSGEERQTNAVKLMSVFRQRPWSTYEHINRMLQQAYIGRIEPYQRVRYNKYTGMITDILKDFPENELNRPLDDIYLLGYNMQKNAFFTQKNDKESEDETNE